MLTQIGETNRAKSCVRIYILDSMTSKSFQWQGDWRYHASLSAAFEMKQGWFSGWSTFIPWC